MQYKKFLAGLGSVSLVATMVVVGVTSISEVAEAASSPAVTSMATVNMNCLAHPPVVGATSASQTISLTSQAPGKVEQGTAYDTFAQPDPSSVPTDLQGYSINNVKNFNVYIPVPAGATRVSEGIVAGTGFGYGGAPSLVYEAGPNRWHFTAPGPISGGSSFQFPKLRFTSTASGSAGATIQPKILQDGDGNPDSNPGFTLTANVDTGFPLGDEDVPTNCEPVSPNPALASTLIIPVDNTAPNATINPPLNGGQYPLDAVVPMTFSCDDGVNGLGVNTCVGSQAQGSPVDTASTGAKSVSVTTTDYKGNSRLVTSTYTIVDQPGIEVQPTSVVEGGAAVFTVKLSKPSALPVSVNYATANGTATQPANYTLTTGTLNFATTDLVKTVSVPTVNDSVYNGGTSFSLNLSSPTNAIISTATAKGDIVENDNAAFTVTGQTVVEATGAQVPFIVTLNGPIFNNLTLNYSTISGSAVAGTDFTDTPGSLTFTPGGPQSQTVNVPVINNTIDSANDANSFTFQVTGAGTVTATGTIVDDDPSPAAQANVGVNVGSTKVVEGDQGNRTAYVIARLEAPQATPVTFTYHTVAMSATGGANANVPGADYKSETGSLQFPAGSVAKAISIGVFSDTDAESNELLRVELQTVTGGPVLGNPIGLITILDDDTPSTDPGVVVSMGDTAAWEGDANTTAGAGGQIDLSLFLNRKAVDDVTVQVAITGGSATGGVDYVNRAPFSATFKQGNLGNKTLQFKVNGDSAAEGIEYFDVSVTLVSGTATIGRATGRVTILDDDDVPSAPLNLTATPRAGQLGAIDLAWLAPISNGGRPLIKYQYRYSNDAGANFTVWQDTGLDTRFVQLCGVGGTCLYEVRAVNGTGAGPASNQASATGIADTGAPSLVVLSPANGQNRDNGSTWSFGGLLGHSIGDIPSVAVNIYACNGCTNIAPTQTLNATGDANGKWAATAATLATGVYTVKVDQTDWNGNTTSVVRTIESRNAIFVSELGAGNSATSANDANAGTADAPKKTIAAATAAAISGNKPEVITGGGNYANLSLTTTFNNKAVRGGFDQYGGWTRAGTSGLSGTPAKNTSRIFAVGEGATVNGTTGLTLDSLNIKGRNLGAAAGTNIYGARIFGSANVSIVNTLIEAEAGVAGGNGATGATANNGSNGNTGGAGTDNGCPAASQAATTGGTGSPNNGGNGGKSGCGNNSGNAGIVGAGTGGGSAGGGGSGSGSFTCGNASPGSGGGGGGGGTGASGAGAAGSNSLASAAATLTVSNGGAGGAGNAGAGGGGGGGGGGHSGGITCNGTDAGGAGGSGGGGGGAGQGGTGATTGGSSIGLYVFNATVSVDAATSVTAGNGGVGGNGGAGSNGGNGGVGGQGGTVSDGDGTGNSCSGCPDGGAGGGGGGAGGGQGGAGGGGGAGGHSVSIFKGGTGTLTNAATTARGTAASGGTGGLAGAGGAFGAGGAGASGTWTNGNPVGVPGTAGGNGLGGTAGPTGTQCRVFTGGACALS